MSRHRVISKHFVRRMARAELRHLHRMQKAAREGDVGAQLSLREYELADTDKLHVERAGRLRARWIVARVPR